MVGRSVFVPELWKKLQRTEGSIALATCNRYEGETARPGSLINYRCLHSRRLHFRRRLHCRPQTHCPTESSQ